MKKFVISLIILAISGLITIGQDNTNVSVGDVSKWGAAKKLTNPPTQFKFQPFDLNAESYVDYVTGAKRYAISMPSIKSYDLSLNIGLSYNSNGIQEDQIASWVGMGWNFQPGGAITRKLNGFPDEKPIDDEGEGGGYFYRGQKIVDFLKSDATRENRDGIIDQLYDKNYDNSPDEFMLQMPGYSGKIVFDHNQNPHLIPQANFIVNFDKKDNKISEFTIINDKGIEYIFGRDENAIEEKSIETLVVPININAKSNDGPNPNIYHERKSAETKNPHGYFNSKWYLVQINSPTGDFIDFEYHDEGEIINVCKPDVTEFRARIILTHDPDRGHYIFNARVFDYLNWTINYEEGGCHDGIINYIAPDNRGYNSRQFRLFNRGSWTYYFDFAWQFNNPCQGFDSYTAIDGIEDNSLLELCSECNKGKLSYGYEAPLSPFDGSPENIGPLVGSTFRSHKYVWEDHNLYASQWTDEEVMVPVTYTVTQARITEKIKRLASISTKSGTSLNLHYVKDRADVIGEARLATIQYKNFKGKITTEYILAYNTIVSESLNNRSVFNPFSPLEYFEYNKGRYDFNKQYGPSASYASDVWPINSGGEKLAAHYHEVKFIYEGLKAHNYKRLFLKSVTQRIGNNYFPPSTFKYNKPEKLARRTTIWTDKDGFSYRDTWNQDGLFLGLTNNFGYFLADGLDKIKSNGLTGVSYGDLVEITIPTGGYLKYNEGTKVTRIDISDGVDVVSKKLSYNTNEDMIVELPYSNTAYFNHFNLYFMRKEGYRIKASYNLKNTITDNGASKYFKEITVEDFKVDGNGVDVNINKAQYLYMFKNTDIPPKNYTSLDFDEKITYPVNILMQSIPRGGPINHEFSNELIDGKYIETPKLPTVFKSRELRIDIVDESNSTNHFYTYVTPYSPNYEYTSSTSYESRDFYPKIKVLNWGHTPLLESVTLKDKNDVVLSTKKYHYTVEESSESIPLLQTAKIDKYITKAREQYGQQGIEKTEYGRRMATVSYFTPYQIQLDYIEEIVPSIPNLRKVTDYTYDDDYGYVSGVRSYNLDNSDNIEGVESYQVFRRAQDIFVGGEILNATEEAASVYDMTLPEYNMLAQPIEKYSYYTTPEGISRVVSAELKLFNDYSFPKPYKVFTINKEIDYDDFTPLRAELEGSVVNAIEIKYDDAYSNWTNFTYNNYLQLISQYDNLGNKQALIWGYNNTLPVAQAINALSDDIYYNNFDDNSWSDYTDLSTCKCSFYEEIDVYGGEGYLKIQAGGLAFRKEMLISDQDGTYIFSAWVKTQNGFSGDNMNVIIKVLDKQNTQLDWLTATVQDTDGKWRKVERKVNLANYNGEVKLLIDLWNANDSYYVLVDNIRFQPAKAQMTTYTHNPGVGVTSVRDPNDIPTFYEYDEFNRLKQIIDKDGNVSEYYGYNYASTNPFTTDPDDIILSAEGVDALQVNVASPYSSWEVTSVPDWVQLVSTEQDHFVLKVEHELGCSDKSGQINISTATNGDKYINIEQTGKKLYDFVLADYAETCGNVEFTLNYCDISQVRIDLYGLGIDKNPQVDEYELVCGNFGGIHTFYGEAEDITDYTGIIDFSAQCGFNWMDYQGFYFKIYVRDNDNIDPIYDYFLYSGCASEDPE